MLVAARRSSAWKCPSGPDMPTWYSFRTQADRYLLTAFIVDEKQTHSLFEPLCLGCARLDSHCSTERPHDDRALRGILFRLIDAAVDRNDPFMARFVEMGGGRKENDFLVRADVRHRRCEYDRGCFRRCAVGPLLREHPAQATHIPSAAVTARTLGRPAHGHSCALSRHDTEQHFW